VVLGSLFDLQMSGLRRVREEGRAGGRVRVRDEKIGIEERESKERERMSLMTSLKSERKGHTADKTLNASVEIYLRSIHHIPVALVSCSLSKLRSS